MKNFPEKPVKKRIVYLDHAATTYVDPEVKIAMDPYFSEVFANPSALYKIGREANMALSSARESVAGILGARPECVIFTGGGTESDNAAIFGVTRKHQDIGRHIITTGIEHHGVLHPLERLREQGFDVTFLRVNEVGLVDPREFQSALRSDTILVSIMYANNEIGTVEPIAEIGREILKWRRENDTPYPFFHSDACQAAGALSLDVEKLHVDLLTLNGSKIYGPKGVGILYKRRGVQIEPLIHGGGQEMGLRSGTENVPGIVGFARALELAQKNRSEENARLTVLRNYFWEQIREKIGNVHLNGPELGAEDARLPNNLNISVIGVEGEAVLLYLDEYGIVCSTGSACTSTSLEPSHVILACHLPHVYAHGSLRFSLGRCNTRDDIDYVMAYLPGIVDRLREMSPVKLDDRASQDARPRIWQR